MINAARLQDEFLELAAIASPSRREGTIARRLESILKSMGAMGRGCRTRSTGGGSDANVFVERGLEIANLACGLREIHTVNEWVDLRDLVLTAGLVLETIRLNAA